jgi:glucose-6-phosphate-specific signal transduction histidine kinase
MRSSLFAWNPEGVPLIVDDSEGGADPARGTGLIGLKDRVEAMGGTIVVESPVGHGTALFVELPVDEADSPSLRRLPARKGGGSCPSSASPSSGT